ncbi:MAG: LysM domain-containing protein [Cyanobium sp. D14.bin.5]|nr:LysM domain-containing protein [Cyanobium sp. D14.bin.5]
MTTQNVLVRLAAIGLGLAVFLPCLAETQEQIEQRLEHLRLLDADAARRRQEAIEFQERRKREEYARRWKRYGDEEIDVLKWRQQKDRTWVTKVTKVPEQAVVRLGDTVVKIAQRYGLTLKELLRLNPGLETARLVVGTQVVLAQSALDGTPVVLRLKPTTSGVISMPELPGFVQLLPSRQPARFDSSIDALVRAGAVSPAERNQILGAERADSLIGVSCTSLMVNRKPAYERWGTWTRPGRGTSDEQLVIDRCAASSHATPK